MKSLISLLLVFITYSIGVSQTTYSSSPAVGTYGSCPSSNLTTTTCNLSYLGQFCQLTAYSISGNQITFRVKKCDGKSFITGAKFYVKESSSSSTSSVVCGTTSSGIDVGGKTTGSYTYPASFTSGTRYFCGVIIIGNTRYYTNVISVSAKTFVASLSILPLSNSVKATSGSTTFSVTANVKSEILDNATWLTVSPTGLNGNGTITCTYTANTSTTLRTATIAISGGGISKTVTIIQDGTAATINGVTPVEPADRSFFASSDITLKFKVNGNPSATNYSLKIRKIEGGKLNVNGSTVSFDGGGTLLEFPIYAKSYTILNDVATATVSLGSFFSPGNAYRYVIYPVGFSTKESPSKVFYSPVKIPLAGNFVVTPAANPRSETVWYFWQHKTDQHAAGKGVGGANDTYAYDCNLANDKDNSKSIYASADGVIMTSSDFSDWGKDNYGQILIRHGDNPLNYWYTGILHVKNITSKKYASTLEGRLVRSGEYIGQISNISPITPSLPNHLHYSIYFNENNVLTSKDFGSYLRSWSSTAFNTPTLSNLNALENQLYIKKINIYPNPATDFLTVEITESDLLIPRNLSMYLYDVEGKELVKHSMVLHNGKNMATLSLKDLISGHYYLKLEAEKYQHVVKVVVNK